MRLNPQEQTAAKETPSRAALGEAGTNPAEKTRPCGGKYLDCRLIQKVIRFLGTAITDRFPAHT
jgi:hypothetical protein